MCERIRIFQSTLLTLAKNLEPGNIWILITRNYKNSNFKTSKQEISHWLLARMRYGMLLKYWERPHHESKLDYFIKEKLRFLFGEAVFPISFCKGRSWSQVLQIFFWPSIEVVSCCCKCSFSFSTGAALTPSKDANDSAMWIPIYPGISVIMNCCITRIEVPTNSLFDFSSVI